MCASRKKSFYERYAKRPFDLVLSAFLLVVTCPLLLLITLLLSIVNNGKPFFLQTRPGKDGKNFTIIKFKTMRDKPGHLADAPDEARITRVGKWIRATSVDELPQLINVIFGKMSLVGPRPLLPEYLPFYNERQKRRQDVRPGITGMAQVAGRNLLSWQKKFELDVYYVDHISFALDCRLLLRTFLLVLRFRGAKSGESSPAEKFAGNESSQYKNTI